MIIKRNDITICLHFFDMEFLHRDYFLHIRKQIYIFELYELRTYLEKKFKL